MDAGKKKHIKIGGQKDRRIQKCWNARMQGREKRGQKK